MRKGNMSVFLLILFVPGLVYADCTDSDVDIHEEARLRKDIFSCASNYRPVKDHKSTVNVKVRLALKYMSFDNTEEKMTLNSWVAINWKDEFLKWTPSDYSNINDIQMESHEIWSPPLVLFNADASVYQPERFYTSCLLENDGTVTCVPEMSHTAICRTSLARWPYDLKFCTLYFGSMTHTQEQVNFTFYKTRPVALEDFQNPAGWRLLKVFNHRVPKKYSCCPNTTYTLLKYTFMLQRVSGGPAAIIVVPSVVVILLTLSSLLLDIKDNTRLGMICFSLFGHFNFINEIDYFVPKLCAETPIILLFVRDSMIVTLVGVLETLFLMYLRRRKIPAPTWVVSINRLATSGPAKYVVFTEFDPCETEPKVVTEEGSANDSDDRTPIETDWIKFANLLNSCVFIVSFLVYIVLIFMYIPFGNKV